MYQRRAYWTRKKESIKDSALAMYMYRERENGRSASAIRRNCLLYVLYGRHIYEYHRPV